MHLTMGLYPDSKCCIMNYMEGKNTEPVRRNETILDGVLVVKSLDDIKRIVFNLNANQDAPVAILYEQIPGEPLSSSLFIEVARSRYGTTVPLILVASEHTLQYQRTDFLNAGGDYVIPYEDYPIVPKMIEAYKKKRSMREQVKKEENFEPFNGFILDTRSKKLFIHNQEISITGQEYRTLEILVKKQGSPVKKSDFIDSLNRQLSRKVLSVIIHRLRAKIKPFQIKTLVNYGYQLVNNSSED